jgi:hypothetical protein
VGAAYTSGTLPCMNKQKQQQWESVNEVFRSTVDGRGKRLDSGILQTVVALNVFSFSTIASCEGHMDWGHAAPWVDLSTENYTELQEKYKQLSLMRKKILGEGVSEVRKIKEQDPLEDLRRQEEVLRQPLLRKIQLLFSLLDNFYTGRVVPFDVRLNLRPLGALVVRMESQGAIIQASSELRRFDKLREYQLEMETFCQFLQRRFFK